MVPANLVVPADRLRPVRLGAELRLEAAPAADEAVLLERGGAGGAADEIAVVLLDAPGGDGARGFEIRALVGVRLDDAEADRALADARRARHVRPLAVKGEGRVAVGEGGVGVRRVDDLLGDAPLVEIRVDGELAVRLDGAITRVAGSSPLFKTTSQYPTLSSCANLHVVSAHTIVSCSRSRSWASPPPPSRGRT